MPNTADLLGDIAALKAMLIASEARDKRKDERIARLEKLVAAFRQAVFGRKSEKSDPDQFELALEDLETAMAVIHAEEDAEDRAARRPAKPRAANRGSLPKHLPRIEEVIEPESLTCACGGCLHCIGEDVSERLDIVPARFRVIVTRRPKYACRTCTDGVTRAPAPSHLIMGGLPTEATLAHVLVSKSQGTVAPVGPRKSRRRRSSAILSAEPDPGAGGARSAPCCVGRLGGPRRLRIPSRPGRADGGPEAVHRALHGRDARPGPRPGGEKDKDGILLGACPR